jgi:CRP-like cAMP-binding protein
MERFFAYLLRYGAFNPDQLAYIESKLMPLSLEKGAYFSEAGKIAKKLGFITSGILRICYIDQEGNDITRLFIVEGQFALDIDSFNTGAPSHVYFEALTDSHLLTLSKEDYIALGESIPGWNEALAKIGAAALAGKLKASRIMISQDATTRYLDFLEHYPGLINRVSHSAVASFLGITPSSLSRIRKEILSFGKN